MAGRQMLKMFHLGKNMKLSYSVLTVLKQNLNQRLNPSCLWSYYRVCTYCTTGSEDRNSSSQLKSTKYNRREQHAYSTKHKTNFKNSKERKLHNRVLTDTEINENKMLWEGQGTLTEEDSFGMLSDDIYENEQRSGEKLSEHVKKMPKKHELNHITTESPEFKEQNVFWKVRETERDGDSFGSLSTDKRMFKKQSKRENLEDSHLELSYKPMSFSDSKSASVTNKRGDHDTLGTQRTNKSRDNEFRRDNMTSPNRDTRKTVRQRKQDIFADTFGILASEKDSQISTTNVYDEIETENDNEGSDTNAVNQPFRRLLPSRKNRNHLYYARKIIKKGKQGKVKEAISILEDGMLKEDRVMPSPYVFTLLIGICGRVGYTKKAFQLFNKMKKMGLPPQDPTYTALFNACSNSPWKEDGLTRANNLRELMMIKGYEPNLLTYKAMVKAYACCGDMKEAFLIADEAFKKCKLDSEFFSFLLMATVSDKKAGFRHAIEVWRMMRQKRMKPDVYHYNLLLRVIKECGIGDQEFINNLIPAGQRQNPTETQKKLPSGNTASLEIEDDRKPNGQGSDLTEKAGTSQIGSDKSDLEWQQYDINKRKTKQKPQTSSVQVISQSTNQRRIEIPDILNPRENYHGVISLGEILTAEDRMSLLGGILGYLQHMENDGARADIRTFTQLLDVIPQTEEAEIQLIEAMKKARVKPDVDFFNMLIRRRCFRSEYQVAKDVIGLIKQYKLKSNLRTFCCLAMTCDKKDDAQQLLQDMEEIGLVPTVEVMGTLIRKSHMNFMYKKYILIQMEMLNIKPNEKVLDRIERDLSKARELIIMKEKNTLVSSYHVSDRFSDIFLQFKNFYNEWLQRMEVDKPEHPWSSFRTTKDQDQSSGVIQM